MPRQPFVRALIVFLLRREHESVTANNFDYHASAGYIYTLNALHKVRHRPIYDAAEVATEQYIAKYNYIRVGFVGKIYIETHQDAASSDRCVT